MQSISITANLTLTMKASSPPRPSPKTCVNGSTKCTRDKTSNLFSGNNKIVDELVDRRISLNCRGRGCDSTKEISRCYPQCRVVSPISETRSPLSERAKARPPTIPVFDDNNVNVGNKPSSFSEGSNFDDDYNDDLVGLAFLDED